MNLQEQKTWQTLQNLVIDDSSASFQFSDRLARENGWSKKFALQCIEEYKKFVFLAKHAGHPVTPSLEVDEAWHLHMIYTRSYWGEMCKEIDFQLHHGPTKGGKAEDVKFTDWYAKTKDSYRKFFGEPPIVFWPSSEIRFAPQDIVKVDRKNFFLFKRPKFGKRTAVLSCTILPLIILFAGATLVGFLIGILAITAIAIIIGIVRRNNAKKELELENMRNDYIKNYNNSGSKIGLFSTKNKNKSSKYSSTRQSSSSNGCSSSFTTIGCSSYDSSSHSSDSSSNSADFGGGDSGGSGSDSSSSSCSSSSCSSGCGGGGD